jgi:hypothetical protein
MPPRFNYRRARLRGLRGLGDGTYLPAGSVLTYSVQWQTSPFHVDTAQQILASIRGQLAAQGIVVDNYSDAATSSSWTGWLENEIAGTTAPAGFVIQVHTTMDFGQAADVQSIIDGNLYNAGRSVVSSQIKMDGGPGTAPAPIAAANPLGLPDGAWDPKQVPQPPKTDWTSYIGWAALGLGAALVVREVL